MKVAVLCGGWSGERDISLLSAASVVKGLKEGGHRAEALDLLPDRRPEGRAPRPATPRWARAVRLSGLLTALQRGRHDVSFLCLHGPGGEDGRLQGMLDLAGLRYTGSGALASALAMDKDACKRLWRGAGLPTPRWTMLEAGARAPRTRLPVVVKPPDQGSALGVTVARDGAALERGIRLARRLSGRVMLERFVAGRELTVGVLEGRALPVVEIVPKHAFYDWSSKYEPGGSRHLCPAPIPAAAAARARALALKAHRLLGCAGYSRSDLILDGRGGLWLLETNTLPGMTPVSLLPDAARAAGLAYPELLNRMMKAS